MTPEEEKRFLEIQREISRLVKEQNAILSGKDITRRAPQKRLTDSDIDVAFAGLMRMEKSHERIAS